MRLLVEWRAIYTSLIALLPMVLALSAPTGGQTVREKLEQTTDYQPRATQPDEQLIEVARRFKIPVAIEWLDETTATSKFKDLKFEKGSVRDLIRAIVARAPYENLSFDDRVVRIYAPSTLNHELNFLNLRLKNYCVSDESVFGANFAVRLGIDMMLYPKEFENGFGGGYGGGERLLWLKAINLCVENRTIRELLTEITAQSGHAGWVARIKPEELQGKKPFWTNVPLNEYGTSPITGHWQFFALVEDDR